MFAVRVPPSLCFPKTTTHADYLSYIIEISRRRPYQNSEGELRRGRDAKICEIETGFLFPVASFSFGRRCRRYGASDAIRDLRWRRLRRRVCLRLRFTRLVTAEREGASRVVLARFSPFNPYCAPYEWRPLGTGYGTKATRRDRKSDADAICERSTQPAEHPLPLPAYRPRAPSGRRRRRDD